jgi:hypothetical protein
MHGFLIIPTSIIPEWTKKNVPTYHLGRFSNDGAFMLIDDAHPATTYAKWLGPNIAELDTIMDASSPVTAEQINILSLDPSSIWFSGGGE